MRLASTKAFRSMVSFSCSLPTFVHLYPTIFTFTMIQTLAKGARSLSTLCSVPSQFAASQSSGTTSSKPFANVTVGQMRYNSSWTGLRYDQHSPTLDEWTNHTQLKEWITNKAKLLKPDNVHLCGGSEEENQRLLNEMVQAGKDHPR